MIAIIDDDESMQESLHDLIELGSWRGALDQQESSLNPICIVAQHV